MNMNIILEWVKANLLIIIFLAIAIGALVAMPIIASGMNQQVRDEVQQRSARLGDLSNLERAQITMPGEEDARTGVINEHLLDLYRQSVELAQEDAERVYELALERNQQGRTVVMAEMFPSPPAHQREILPRQFHERMMRAYDELLAEIGGGAPPHVDVLREELDRREEQFIGQILARDPNEPLPEEERQRLREQLAELRLAKYQDAAERYSMYLSRHVLNLPVWDQRSIPSTAELFERQWRYWIHSDVLRALKAANANAPSLLQGPVKRVVRFEFASAPSTSEAGQRGFGGASGDEYGQADGPVGPVTVNTTAEAPRDYRASFTGRTRNQLYDVRYVNLELIVDTQRLPEVLDAIAQQNFMTITSLQVAPANPFEDARDGFYYGREHVSRVMMQIETVWLRSWTAQYMPAATRAALGIAAGTSGGYM